MTHREAKHSQTVYVCACVCERERERERERCYLYASYQLLLWEYIPGSALLASSLIFVKSNTTCPIAELA